MSILVGNDTKLAISGFTGREGSFHGLNNKNYGTEILVSEAVRERVAEKFVFKLVDTVRPKGFEAAVSVYELAAAMLQGVEPTKGPMGEHARWT